MSSTFELYYNLKRVLGYDNFGKLRLYETAENESESNLKKRFPGNLPLLRFIIQFRKI